MTARVRTQLLAAQLEDWEDLIYLALRMISSSVSLFTGQLIDGSFHEIHATIVSLDYVHKGKRRAQRVWKTKILLWCRKPLTKP